MQTYRNRGGTSPISAFETGPDTITVQFADGAAYVYNVRSAGQKHIAAMQRLAVDGQGLATYITRHVRDRYARRLG
ncbi:MAG: hypothetical protein JWP29_4234 [Rhodoferax sp.]|nr:hypothetical protein [Rhodoferax sp.]